MRDIARPLRAPIPMGAIALVLFLAFFAALSGAATALTSSLAVFIFGGIVVGSMALLMPLHWLVIGLFAGTFVAVGQLVYFGGIEKANWIPFLVGLLLFVRFPIDLMHSARYRVAEVQVSSLSLKAMKFFIGLFFGTLFVSTLINGSTPIQILVTAKEYVFLWGLYLILATGLIRKELVERIWAWLPWLLLLQLPLILYQRFVVMSTTRAQAKWDVIVGVFGGNQDGGGASGAMGFFCLICIVTSIYRFQAKLIPGWQMLLLVFSGVLTIALAEVKYMILLLPVCFLLIFMRQIKRRPFLSTIAICLGFVLAIGVATGYNAQFSGSHRQMTLKEYAEESLTGQTDQAFLNVTNRTQGRMAALAFWYQQQSIYNPVALLVGQGAGSSRITMTFVGEAQKKYFQNLARSTLAILLWETGIIGTLAYVGMLAFAWVTHWSKGRDLTRSAESRATLQPMSVAIVLLGASLPYDQNLLFNPQLQLLLMLTMGYAAMVDRPYALAQRGVAVSNRAGK